MSIREIPGNPWRTMESAPKSRFVQLRGRLDLSQTRENTYKASFHSTFKVFVTPKGNQVASSAWRELP